MVELSDILKLEELLQQYDLDTEYIDSLKEGAGKGMSGNFESLNLGMAEYHLLQAADYLGMIVDEYDSTLMQRYDVDGYGSDGSDAEVEHVRVISIVDPDGAEIEFQNGKRIGDLTSLAGKPNITTSSSWLPGYKDPEKLKFAITDYVKGYAKGTAFKPGFQGWLAAQVTITLGGKSDPSLVLKMIDEVYEERGFTVAA